MATEKKSATSPNDEFEDVFEDEIEVEKVSVK
jgi:hypothetical protein